MKINSISFAPISAIKAVELKKQNYKTNPIVFDTFSFSGIKNKNELLTEAEGLEASAKLKSSTSGYRAKLGDKFNDEFINTMTNAYAKYLKDNGYSTTVIGGDTREATKKYLPVIQEILQDKGINVIIPNLPETKAGEYSPVASPLLAYSVKNEEIPLGILMTASHNPWDDGGYNFLTSEGAVADDRITVPLANNLEKISREGKGVENSNIKGKVTYIDVYTPYMEHIKENNLIDFEKIKNAGIEIYYESLKGCGGYYFPRMLEENGINVAKVLNSDAPGPEPTAKNLKNLANEVKNSNSKMKIGLANDGDSDRFGVIDENGNFIGPDDVITLVSYHMIKNLGMTKGTIIRNVSTSRQIDYVAKYFNELNPEKYNIDVKETPVGFKYLGGLMLELEGSEKEAIVAGEQSGGLAIRNHIPEKDGFVAISKILELMAYENKPIGEILKEIKEKTGADYGTTSMKFKFSDDNKKESIQKYFDKMIKDEAPEIAGEKIDIEATKNADNEIRKMKPEGDGAKFILENGTSVQVRKSGTEPILRVTIDSNNKEVAKNISENMSEILENLGGIQA